VPPIRAFNAEFGDSRLWSGKSDLRAFDSVSTPRRLGERRRDKIFPRANRFISKENTIN
jgi:hypothetical protein